MDGICIGRRVAEAESITIGSTVEVAEKELRDGHGEVEGTLFVQRLPGIEQSMADERRAYDVRCPSGDEENPRLPIKVVTPAVPRAVRAALRFQEFHQVGDLPTRTIVQVMPAQPNVPFEKKAERFRVMAGTDEEHRTKVDGAALHALDDGHATPLGTKRENAENGAIESVIWVVTCEVSRFDPTSQQRERRGFERIKTLWFFGSG